MRCVFFKNISLLSSLAVIGACSHSRPGTHVEIIQLNGRDAYVAGAAAVQTNRAFACKLAVQRAANAVAREFAHQEEDVGNEVADELEAESGSAFLFGYANSTILNARVQDTTYNPKDHVCMATVRWQPPIFLRKALLEYAKRVRDAEVKSAKVKTPAPPKKQAVRSTDSGKVEPETTKDSVLVERLPKVSCAKERRQLKRVFGELGKREVTYDHCMLRMEGDVEQCYVFQLPLERVQVKEKAARKALKRCESLQ